VRSKSFIEGVVESEEKRFADTLRFSLKVLDEEIAELKAKDLSTIPGDVAFKLYDTYGLPIDIVEDVARAENLLVDMESYENAMSRQRSMSQESWKGSGEEEIPEAYRNLITKGLSTSFVGYDTLISNATVIAVLIDGKEVTSGNAGDQAEIVLDQTPFYGKSGGQVGDEGILVKGNSQFEVADTLKIGQGLVIHKGRFRQGGISAGDLIEARVDALIRESTACNHSATHLLHKALREVLGDHVKQAGSLVSPSRLRFDFSHFTQVSQENLTQVEDLVNGYIRDNLSVQTEEMTKEEAMKTGAMAIFEERYGEKVRVVGIGDGQSMELCGGTHTKHTGGIGLFRIISESAVAANVRRIEALTGSEALRYDQDQEKNLKSIASLLKTAPDKITERLERLLAEYKEKDKAIEALKAKLLSKKSENFLSGVREINGIKILARELEAESQKELRESADKIKDKLGSGIILLGAKNEGKVMLICMVTKDLTKRFKAGDIIKHLSGIVGGKGGGRPDMAQGGGSQPEKMAEALEASYSLIEQEGS